MTFPAALRRFVWGGLVFGAASAFGETVDFRLPAQRADKALLVFSRQAKTEVLFSFEELSRHESAAVVGAYPPETAILRLLEGTGFSAHRNGGGKYLVTRDAVTSGTIHGRVVRAGIGAARGIRIALSGTKQATVTNESGEFELVGVSPGPHQVIATAEGYDPLPISAAPVEAGRVLVLEPKELQTATDLTRLAPFVVRDYPNRTWTGAPDRSAGEQRTATGNLDLRRTADDALPYAIYRRDQITRSGVVHLNEFLQRELLESDAASRAPEQGTGPGQGSGQLFVGSTNLKMRGYEADETVILVNGRRMPEVITSWSGRQNSADANVIPLNLIEQIEVLPASASALYSGNPVGGVINIVLRSGPDASGTEVSATYTNALRGFDAPQSTVSLLHGQTLLDGALQVRFNASFSRALPPTEAELHYVRARGQPAIALDSPIYRATPNIRTANLTPLFGPGTASVTSVNPGADGTDGLAAFAGREGVRNLQLFDSPGGLAPSPNSLDNPYGRRESREAYFGSATYDIAPWLQIGLDGTYARTVIHRGFDVMSADLKLPADSSFNPFRQDVLVSLNDTAPKLGQDYSTARLDFASAVLGVVVKLPAAWRLSLDAQYARNLSQYRGLVGANGARWQRLVDTGLYNPLRDTQVFGPPPEFYDRVLVFRGTRGRWATLGDYNTMDAALRVTNETIPLPTGVGTVNAGVDFRRNHLESFRDVQSFGDGSPANEPADWEGRTLGRYSVFGELQAPLLPVKRRPAWLRNAEADLAVRYIASDTARESNVAPTLGLKVDFAGGLSVRGSFTTSNRFPTPQMSRPVSAGAILEPTVESTPITDPVRNQVVAEVPFTEVPNPALLPEAAVTQTAGLVLQRGKIHRFRFSLDFVDTRKVNEIVLLDPQMVVNLEQLFPDRVDRAELAPDDPNRAGEVLAVRTGLINMAGRHSQNWNASCEYSWSECLGGRLEAYGRLLYMQRYDLQGLPTSPVVDELRHPDGGAPAALKYRANFGVSWSKPSYGLGVDGHYFHSRVLPIAEWLGQGHDRIRPYWQFDAYLQGELGRWLPWQDAHHGLRAQVRVNNLFGAGFPKYVNDASAAGVQPYGDWRGTTYSLSLTATF